MKKANFFFIFLMGFSWIAPGELRAEDENGIFPGGERPVLYLTFDDGPSSDQTTDRLLELLARFQAKATFFVVGKRAQRYPEKISAIASAGHAIGNHSMSHENFSQLEEQDFLQSILDTRLAIIDGQGPLSPCFRPPGGNLKRRGKDLLKSLDFQVVLWDHDPRDWRASSSSEQVLNFLEDAKLGHGDILLFHDGPTGQGHSLEALEIWFERWGGDYRFEALPKCLQPLE